METLTNHGGSFMFPIETRPRNSAYDPTGPEAIVGPGARSIRLEVVNYRGHPITLIADGFDGISSQFPAQTPDNHLQGV
jgi:hypothetical protein